jgi:GH15 family glucan-1,4-alpha-glucosidase
MPREAAPELQISDYGMLGDTRTAALVSREGSIDWLCWPRYDDLPLFGRLIDPAAGGHFRLWAKGGRTGTRAYHDRSPVLESSIECDGGKARLIDAMPFRRRGGPIIVRRLECLAGRIEPLLEYAPARSRLTKLVGWREGPLAAGEAVTVVLTNPGDDYTVERALNLVGRSERWWNEWCAGINAGVTHAELLIRSLITLRLLTYTPSGAPVAAPTTSLPEEIGGVRNWDYRFAWPRDASVGVAAMIAAGRLAEAEGFLSWLVRHASGRAGLRVMYRVDGRQVPKEVTREDLAGYRSSRPVRFGNLAAEQTQLDVAGWVIDALWGFVRTGATLHGKSWAAVARYADQVMKRWREPDCGLWEVRDRPRHYVHSKVWAWIALDRAVKIAEALEVAPRKRSAWARERDLLHHEIQSRGFDPRLGYTRAYDSTEPDSALLLLALTEVDTDRRRLRKTVNSIRSQLSAGGPLLYRYPPGSDGLPGREGAFVPCTFWLLEALLRLGHQREGEDVLNQLLGLTNELRLLPEEIDPASGEYLGNYPLALSHAGLVHAILEIQIARGERAPY